MRKLIFLFCIISFSSSAQQPGPVKQGISGVIYLKQGDGMPVPGRKQSKGAPVSRRVLIYKLTNAKQVTGGPNFFNTVQSGAVVNIQSNDKGEYAISLPEGSYSIFILESGVLYANDFDAEGHICPVTVVADKVTKKDVVISHGALN